MSLVKFPPSGMAASAAASSSVSDTDPLLGPAKKVRRHVQKQCQENLVPSSHDPSVFPLFCVIGAVLLERITYYGILANLTLFLTSDLSCISSSSAISIVLVFAGMAWFMSTVGGFIGDVVSGRYNAIWGSLLIYIVGASVLLITAYFNVRFINGPTTKALAYLSLFIISIGEGAYKANISAFGAEQVEEHDDNIYRKYFNWYYWSINLGSFIAYSGIAYLQLKVNFFCGFVVSFCCILLATVVFCCGRNFYVINSPTGYFKKVYQIMKEARSRKRQDTRPSYPGLEDYVPRKSWLDRAMMKYGGSYLDCEVEEVKILGKIIVVFMVLIPYWSIYYQMNTTFLVQGVHMKIRQKNNSRDDNEFILPPSWLSLIDIMIVLILIPIVDRIVYPYMDRQGWNLSVVRRISIGFLFAVVSMIIAGLVEIKRWNSPQNYIQEIGNTTYIASEYSIYYQIPQYAFIGISEVFTSVGGLELAYRYAPKHMQGFVMGLFYLVQSAGSWVGVGLFLVWKEIQNPHVTKHIQSKRGHEIHDKNDLKLQNYFFLLAGVMFVTWLIFLVVSRRYALPQHYHKKVTFIVHQKSTEGGQEKLRQSPLVSTDVQSDVC